MLLDTNQIAIYIIGVTKVHGGDHSPCKCVSELLEPTEKTSDKLELVAG